MKLRAVARFYCFESSHCLHCTPLDMLTPIEILLLTTLIFYAIVFVFLQIGLWKSDSANIVADYSPNVTVIVAARNEEENIAVCLDSLVKLDYPVDKLEIIVISDHSTDKTYSIIEGYMQKYSFVKGFEARAEQGNLRGKTNALTQAIEFSSGEILMFTDADCTVSPDWVRQTIKYFDEETGIVGGYTNLKANNIFEGIQSLDWLVLFSISSGTAGWKIPLTAIGNNISVRKEAYEQAGGYYAIPFSVTEDYALVRQILSKTKFQLKFPLLPGATISSKACSSIKQLYRQKKRWAVGGLDMIPHGLVLFSFTWMFSLSLLAGIFTAHSSFLLGTVASKLCIDFSYLFRLSKKVQKIQLLKYIFIFEAYFILYVLLIPFVALLSKKIIWKERHL